MMQDSLNQPPLTASEIAPIADAAARAIPPVWPLASSVAVNPYLGQAGLDLATTAALLARVSDAPATMARSWYRERIANGTITDGDLAAALAACTASVPPRERRRAQACGAAPACPQGPAADHRRSGRARLGHRLARDHRRALGPLDCRMERRGPGAVGRAAGQVRLARLAGCRDARPHPGDCRPQGLCPVRRRCARQRGGCARRQRRAAGADQGGHAHLFPRAADDPGWLGAGRPLPAVAGRTYRRAGQHADRSARDPADVGGRAARAISRSGAGGLAGRGGGPCCAGRARCRPDHRRHPAGSRRARGPAGNRRDARRCSCHQCRGSARIAGCLLHRCALGGVPSRTGSARSVDPHAGFRRVLRTGRIAPPLRLGRS